LYLNKLKTALEQWTTLAMNISISTDHRDEMLINIIQTKPGLWNYQIPLSERTKKESTMERSSKYVRRFI